MSQRYSRVSWQVIDCQLEPKEPIPNYLGKPIPIAECWKRVRDHRGDSYALWCTETHLLASPVEPWRDVQVGSITEDPKTWLGTHIVWVGK